MSPTRGTRREHQVRNWLQQRDYVVIRAAGSFGCADLVALKHGGRPLFIEVKSTARGPYEHFPPTDRQDLIATAARAGATPILAWWPPNGTLKMIPAGEWPTTLKAA